ncbi:Pyroglutamyl-peptidase 1 [Coemansia guatemalensis]|uniref:Pyroglutamyl-peptidase 1 n=1 Tax=Coemansia guatemalensis TaxID=2761395 RepID=A0A9W8HYE0_9FUNG|nr:Pyroglutamyl-peptidase 1 [Coemansia guatemalensis]
MHIKHALLTGFEPFGEPRPEKNRSWEAVKMLANTKIETGNATVVCHCHELPVSYDDVSKQIPRLHLMQEFSIVIHCGAGTAGMVRLEKQARKSGYSRPGNKGPTDMPVDGCVPGYSTADVLATNVNVGAVQDALAGMGWDKVRVSLDAGQYLCEYTYYTSLAESKETYPERGLPEPKTLFVHVPPQESDPYDDHQLSEMLREIIVQLT